jgi:hypothetical protein
LRAGLLIRAVREKRLSLFAHGLSALGGFTDEQVRRALSAPSPEALYYACAAVGRIAQIQRFPARRPGRACLASRGPVPRFSHPGFQGVDGCQPRPTANGRLTSSPASACVVS